MPGLSIFTVSRCALKYTVSDLGGNCTEVTRAERWTNNWQIWPGHPFLTNKSSHNLRCLSCGHVVKTGIESEQALVVCLIANFLWTVGRCEFCVVVCNYLSLCLSLSVSVCLSLSLCVCLFVCLSLISYTFSLIRCLGHYLPSASLQSSLLL